MKRFLPYIFFLSFFCDEYTRRLILYLFNTYRIHLCVVLVTTCHHFRLLVLFLLYRHKTRPSPTTQQTVTTAWATNILLSSRQLRQGAAGVLGKKTRHQSKVEHQFCSGVHGTGCVAAANYLPQVPLCPPLPRFML